VLPAALIHCAHCRCADHRQGGCRHRRFAAGELAHQLLGEPGPAIGSGRSARAKGRIRRRQADRPISWPGRQLISRCSLSAHCRGGPTAQLSVASAGQGLQIQDGLPFKLALLSWK